MNCHEERRFKIIGHWTCTRIVIIKTAVAVAVVVILQGCSIFNKDQAKAKAKPLKLDVGSRMPLISDKEEQHLDLGVNKRMLLDLDESYNKVPVPLYKFRAKNMPIVKALDLFARNYDLNLITSSDITGMVTVDFKELPFTKSMDVILDAYGYYWSREGSLIRVYKHETKVFKVDYLKLVRVGSGSSLATIESSTGDESGGISITQDDTVNFWKDIETQLKKMLTKEGKLIINRMSGTIQVTDFHKNVMQVKSFIDSVTGSIERQVEINVKILEVALNNEFSLGINWDKVIKHATSLFTAATSTIITEPVGVAGPKLRTISLGVDSKHFNAVIDALSEQGDVKIVSRPSIRVMNNQPALIKVGTDIPFFNQTTTTGTSGSGNTITEEVRFVTEGLVLSVTPQISEDNLIFMDVTPIISRLEGTAVSTLGSTAPVMNIKQSSTIVRIMDGEMVTIGGLIQDEDFKTTRKVPFFGNIPVLGNLFKGTYTVDGKSELVIFITPNIIKGI